MHRLTEPLPNPLLALSPPAVQDDLHLLVASEIPRQVVVEARLIPRHDEEVTGH